MAASVALIAVQLLPAIEARSLMVLEPKYGAGAYSALSLLRSYLLPNWFDFNPVHATDFDPGCVYLYVGMPALFALGWAIWRHSPRSYGQPVFGLAVALFLANPPHFLLMAVERIPALRFTMQPHNYLAATGAMVALITAIGLDDFLKSGAARNWPGWVPWTGGCAIAAWAVRDLVIWHRGSVFPTGSAAIAPAATGVALFSFGLWCVRCSIGWRRALLAGIVLFGTAADYKVYGSGRWFNAVSGDVDDEFTDYGIRGIDDAGYRAMSENRQYRVFTDDGIGPHPTDYRMWGLATPEGFDPFLSTAYKRTIQHWVPFRTNRLFDVDDHNDEMMQALGVRYAVVRDGTSHDAFLAASPSFRRLGRVDVFCHVYEYLRAKPPFHWEAERSGVAEPSGWVPEQRDFRVRSATGGRFVLVEQFSPGWRATVDGRPAAVERWDGVFQAVRVPPGAHRVRFEFRPACIAAGAAVSLIALAALLTLMRADYRARRAMTIARAA
jgi:hypothetical protein